MIAKSGAKVILLEPIAVSMSVTVPVTSVTAVASTLPRKRLSSMVFRSAAFAEPASTVAFKNTI